jgi:beta-carotene 3-hydroxylase
VDVEQHRASVHRVAIPFRPMRAAAITVVSFVLMEPVTYAAHRWLMHGPGIGLHCSHHRTVRQGRFERNDLFPVLFAGVVLAGMAVGFNVPGWNDLVWVGIGITCYGSAYALVHDVYIHGRLSWFGSWRPEVLDRLAAAHRIHHLYGGEPYGMLLPVVPAALRARAAVSEREALRIAP